MSRRINAELARENKIKFMIDAGYTYRAMAEALGVSRQAVHKFCKRRGWSPTHSDKGGRRLGSLNTKRVDG